MTTAVELAERGHQLAAWVNFDGTLAMTVGSSYGPNAPPADFSSPNPIRAAYNVDYIIDRGTGDYEIHFENAMPDANYCVVTSGDHTSNGSNICSPHLKESGTKSPTQVQVIQQVTGNGGGGATDNAHFMVAIFR